MLDIISSMIDPDDRQQVQIDTDISHVDVLPDALCDRLSESCLLPAIASYLKNDSGMIIYKLDMKTSLGCHIFNSWFATE